MNPILYLTLITMVCLHISSKTNQNFICGTPLAANRTPNRTPIRTQNRPFSQINVTRLLNCRVSSIKRLDDSLISSISLRRFTLNCRSAGVPSASPATLLPPTRTGRDGTRDEKWTSYRYHKGTNKALKYAPLYWKILLSASQRSNRCRPNSPRPPRLAPL
jgi:hypothetical protein